MRIINYLSRELEVTKIFKQIVNSNNSNFNLVEFGSSSTSSFGSSDHASFYYEDIPVLVFSPVNTKITINHQMRFEMIGIGKVLSKIWIFLLIS